jgi:hypothetical protein
MINASLTSSFPDWIPDDVFLLGLLAFSPIILLAGFIAYRIYKL